jgi:hypothetical protein
LDGQIWTCCTRRHGALTTADVLSIDSGVMLSHRAKS